MGKRENMKKILIVDDAEANRSILANMFHDQFNVLQAQNGVEALKVIEETENDFSIILLDLHMPVMNGFELLEILNQRGYMKQVPVILITGDDSADSEKKGYELGASDIIRKPFDPYIVRTRISNIVELYMHKNHLEELVENQTREIKRQAEKLKETNIQFIDALSNFVEFRNLESAQHNHRIRTFTRVLLEKVSELYPEYKLTEDLIEKISLAAAMHDVGKITIPDVILLKPGRLTKDEFEIMKTHTTRGCDIIDMVASIQGEEEFYNYCYEICRYHHERYDGRGYPDGIAKDDIPLAAQVVAIADVYDALVSVRVYKEAYSKETAYQMIMDGECGIFSPRILYCFKLVRGEFENLVDQYKENQ